MKLISIVPSLTAKYKYIATVKDGDSEFTVRFGAKPYKDFIQYSKDNSDIAEDKKRLYLARHSPRENWNKDGIRSAGFWSRWILWNQPTLRQSMADVKKRFSL